MSGTIFTSGDPFHTGAGDPFRDGITGEQILRDVGRLYEQLAESLALPASMILHPTIEARLPKGEGEPTTVFDLQVFTSELATVRRQGRFPRSKRRRIRKKWAKRERNWVEEPAAFVVDPLATERALSVVTGLLPDFSF